MGKLDKIIDIATPLAKDAAIETAKLTGKGLKLAGRGIKEAGSKAVANYKENKAEQINSRYEEMKEQYADGIVFRSYDVTSCSDGKKLADLGLKKYAKDVYGLNLSKLAKVIVNQDNEVHYRIYGDYDAEIKRYFAVYEQGAGKIGSVNEHSKIFGRDYETIKYGGTKLGDLFDNYVFSNPDISIERVGPLFSAKHFIVRNIVGVMMEIEEVRGQEFIAIAYPDRMDECILIYTAIDLVCNPKPEYGGGGEG